jgi:hypothetical protein
MGQRTKLLFGFFFLVSVALIITIPFAITLIWLRRRARIVISDAGAKVVWMDTCELSWSDVEAFRWVEKGQMGTLVTVTAEDSKSAADLSLETFLNVPAEKIPGQFFRKRFEYKLRDEFEWKELALRHYHDPEQILSEFIQRARLCPE